MKWKNTLMAYEEDIKSRGFWDWTKAHIHHKYGLRASDNDEVYEK